MTPEEFERHSEHIRRAKILGSASELYFKAAQAIELGETEEVQYRFIKSAKETIEEVFPEIFQARHLEPKYLIKEENDHKLAKMIAVVVVVLGILYSFVKFGPTGDLTKTWTAVDIPKATAYPR